MVCGKSRRKCILILPSVAVYSAGASRYTRLAPRGILGWRLAVYSACASRDTPFGRIGLASLVVFLIILLPSVVWDTICSWGTRWARGFLLFILLTLFVWDSLRSWVTYRGGILLRSGFGSLGSGVVNVRIFFEVGRGLFFEGCAWPLRRLRIFRVR